MKGLTYHVSMTICHLFTFFLLFPHTDKEMTLSISVSVDIDNAFDILHIPWTILRIIDITKFSDPLISYNQSHFGSLLSGILRI